MKKNIFGLAERFGQMDRKSRTVLLNTMLAFLVKGASLCISLATTPAFIRYFDNNAVLGVWYTLLSVLTWFLSFDLGIGNGIRNNLVGDFSRGDRDSARRTLSSGLLSTGAVTVVLLLIGGAWIGCVDLNWLFHVEKSAISNTVLVKSTMIVFAGIMLRFFLTSISAVFYALQMSAVNDFLGLCVSILQLIFVLVVRPKNAEQGLLLLAVAYVVVSNLPAVIAALVIFGTKLRDCRPSLGFVDREHCRRVMGIGTVFFVCQISYMLIMNTNEFLITNLFGPAYTTEYTFYYKLTSLISMVISLALTPMWSAITKAMEEKSYQWIRQLYRRLKLAGLLSVAVQFAFVVVQQPVMDLWLGENSIQINYLTAIAFACFGGAFTYSAILSTVVCGMARMRLQLICYTAGVILKFVGMGLCAALVKEWVIVVWSNALILGIYAVVQQIDLDRYFRKLTA